MYQGSEVSWTNSKTWLSEQAALRTNYERTRERAAFLGLGSSPFLPQSAFEHAGVKAAARLGDG